MGGEIFKVQIPREKLTRIALMNLVNLNTCLNTRNKGSGDILNIFDSLPVSLSQDIMFFYTTFIQKERYLLVVHTILVLYSNTMNSGSKNEG